MSVTSEPSSPTKVVHLIPYDGIGGVETAARTMACLEHETIHFKVEYVFRAHTQGRSRWTLFNPLQLVAATYRIVIGRVDVLIVSLWRSAIVGILAKLLRPRIKLVVFSHNNCDVHYLDFALTRSAMLLANEVWSDSEASLRDRFQNLDSTRIRVISFVTHRITGLPERVVTPNFVFWGRISHQKGLEISIRLFSEVWRIYPRASFQIVGPDAGALADLHSLSAELGIAENVRFLGPMTMDQIRLVAQDACFYLQTSHFEGMGMSVVEAMQLGLVPIVAPVGEIGAYCISGYNALIVTSIQESLREILCLLEDPQKYHELRANALNTWRGKPLYRDSMLAACMDLLQGE